MRPISFQQKIEAIELYLNGLSTNEIVTKNQISKGTVISILEDAREGRFPGLELKDRIDELHSLSVRLKKEELDLPRARLGFSFLKRLLDMDIEPDEIKEWVDFCSEISPTPPGGFIPAAIALFNLEKSTGKSYAEITTDVKELAGERERLVGEVKDLKADETRAKELRAEIEKIQIDTNKLRIEKDKLESTTKTYISFVEVSAGKLGIPPNEFDARLKELVSLEKEIATLRSQKNKLEGEIEALSERHQKLSSQMGKASLDFDRDMKLIIQTRDELGCVFR